MKIAHFAAKNNSQNVLEFLLSKGININAQTNERRKSAFYAIRGIQEVFEQLLNANADLEIENSEEETVIFEAIRTNNQEFVEELLKKGAKIEKECKGKTPYTLAIQNEDSQSLLFSCKMKQCSV